MAFHKSARHNETYLVGQQEGLKAVTLGQCSTVLTCLLCHSSSSNSCFQALLPSGILILSPTHINSFPWGVMISEEKSQSACRQLTLGTGPLHPPNPEHPRFNSLVHICRLSSHPPITKKRTWTSVMSRLLASITNHLCLEGPL